MVSTAIVEHVFLDAQAYEAASFNFASRHFATLAKHLESGRLTLVITDITKSEVLARIVRNLEREFTALENFQKKARVMRASPLPDVTGVFTELDRDKVTMSISEAFDNFLDQHDATVVEATAQDAAPIFEKYFQRTPPFGSGKKQKEFPDAFVIDSLIGWTNNGSQGLFVVSGDGLFVEACKRCKELCPVKNLVDLLDHVASDDENLSNFLRGEIKKHLNEIKKEVKTKFEDLGFYIIDEWGNVDLVVTDIELSQEPDLIDINGNDVIAELQFIVDYAAELSYEDSDTGTWDSEDQQQIFMDYVEEIVHDSEELVVTVQATVSGTDSEELEIQSIELTDPTSGLGILTSK